MIPIGRISPTQLSVRHHKQVPGMIEFVEDGGFFSLGSLGEYSASRGIRPSPLIQINQFEDGRLFVLDGHHRLIGIQNAGREYVDDSEYEVTHYKYSDFTDIVYTWPNGEWMGWVTPFDPRQRVRLPELKAFKDRVKAVYNSEGAEVAKAFILDHANDYSVLRSNLRSPLNNVKELSLLWQDEFRKIVPNARIIHAA